MSFGGNNIGSLVGALHSQVRRNDNNYVLRNKCNFIYLTHITITLSLSVASVKRLANTGRVNLIYRWWRNSN